MIALTSSFLGKSKSGFPKSNPYVVVLSMLLVMGYCLGERLYDLYISEGLSASNELTDSLRKSGAL